MALAGDKPVSARNTRLNCRGLRCAASASSLHGQGQPEIVYGIIAKRIIEAAKKGERDPIRLRDAGLAALGYKSDIG